MWRCCEAASFGTRKGRESNFHHRGGAVNHVQACLSAKKHGESSFYYCGGLLKLVQAYFSTRKDQVSSFDHSVGAVKHMQGCFKYLQGRRRQFSRLWRYCEARASPFQC